MKLSSIQSVELSTGLMKSLDTAIASIYTAWWRDELSKVAAMDSYVGSVISILDCFLSFCILPLLWAFFCFYLREKFSIYLAIRTILWQLQTTGTRSSHPPGCSDFGSHEGMRVSTFWGRQRSECKMSTYLSNATWLSGCGLFIISAASYTILHNALIRIIEQSETSKILVDSQREFRKPAWEDKPWPLWLVVL